MKELSIEQLAALSADDALRRRMDERNSAALGRMALALAGASAALATKPLIFLLAGERRITAVAPSASGFIVALLAMYASRAITKDHRGMKWLRQRLRAFIGSFLAVEFTLILLAIGSATRLGDALGLLAIDVVYPFMVVLWFRFQTAELIFLHGFLFVAAAAKALQIPPDVESPGLAIMIAMPLAWNAAALGAGIS